MNLKENIKLITEVEKYIFNGLSKGYYQNLIFTQNYSDLQFRVIEYLITVNIAQHLEEFCFKRLLSINLEYPLEKFYNGAFPTLKPSEDFFEESIFKKNHNPIKNKSKRIDIVITGDDVHNVNFYGNKRSLIGVEVKSLNPSNKKISKDINRLANALELKDKVSENKILTGFVCFFKRFDSEKKYVTDEQIEILKIKEKSKWDKKFIKYSKKYNCLKFEFVTKSLIESSVEKVSKRLNSEYDDYQDLLNQSGFVTMQLIKITHKK